MPLRVLATNAPSRFGALRFGALPELGARASVIGSMWLSTVDSIAAQLSVPIYPSASVSTQSIVIAQVSVPIQPFASVSSLTTIAAQMSVPIWPAATVTDGQLVLVFQTPEGRLVELDFNARFMNQEVWRFVGISAGERLSD